MKEGETPNMAKAAKKKEIKLVFNRNSQNAVETSIYLVNADKTKRYMASFASMPGEKVLSAKAWLRNQVAEWVEAHPEWIRVEKEVYDSVKVVW